MAQEEKFAMKRGARIAMFQQNRMFQQVVQEYQRRARLPESEAGLQPSARIETQLTMELRSSQLATEQHMKSRDRENIDRLG